MLRTFREKRKARRALETLVDPQTVESLLRDGATAQPIKRGRIEFVLTFVGGHKPHQVSERIGKVANMAIQHGATVHDLIGALVIVAFGTGPAASASSGGRAALVAALQQQFGADIKIVHGAADGHYGLFGADSRISYTFFVPQFDRALGALGRLPLGAAEEVEL